tara:strand:+ start:169 stop:324 length:156 start_codon:yes stop_codon:yes gene_type:complete
MGIFITMCLIDGSSMGVVFFIGEVPRKMIVEAAMIAKKVRVNLGNEFILIP